MSNAVLYYEDFSEIKKKMNDDIRILFTEYRQKRKGNFNSNIRRISNLDGND